MRETLLNVIEAEISGADSVLHAPERQQRLHLWVRAKVDFDPATRLYTYAYTVRNEATSDSCLETFILAPVSKPVRMESPKHWSGDCCSFEDSRFAANWSVIAEDDEKDPVGYAERGQLSRSVVNPRPGQGTSGFVLVSPAPPTNIRFYAEQFDTLLQGDGDEIAASMIYDYGVTGVIVGPDTSHWARSAPVRDRSSLRFESESMAPPGEATVYLSVRVRGTRKLTLGVFDSHGRCVRRLPAARYETGPWGEVWNGLDDEGRAVTPGTYTFRLLANGKMLSSARVIVPG
jgi:hypothetical protein